MQVNVEFYGVLRRLAGAEVLKLDVPDHATVADVIAQVSERSADLADRMEHCACAIGEQLVSRTHQLEAGTNLVLIPPVSGG